LSYVLYFTLFVQQHNMYVQYYCAAVVNLSLFGVAAFLLATHNYLLQFFACTYV